MKRYKVFLTKILRKLSLTYDEISIRIYVSKMISESLNYTVKYGLFKDLVLLESSWWGKVDKGSQCLGIYEQEVLMSISKMPEFKLFVDVGCADGYYLGGMLKSGKAERAFGFDISQDALQASKLLLATNLVEDRAEFDAYCDARILNDVLVSNDFKRGQSLVLIDIEGHEWDFFDEWYESFNNSYFIIECHLETANDLEKMNALINLFQKFHKVEILRNIGRSPYQYEELNMFKDDYKWIFCSEGRQFETPWLVASPIGEK